MLLALSAFLWWRGRAYAAGILGVIGAALVVFGYLAPSALKWPSAVWWRLAMVLGYANARLILTVAFIVVLSPIGLIWRLLGRDPLGRRRERWPGWVAHHARYRSGNHYRRMY